jgi:hypothetical protein
MTREQTETFRVVDKIFLPKKLPIFVTILSLLWRSMLLVRRSFKLYSVAISLLRPTSKCTSTVFYFNIYFTYLSRSIPSIWLIHLNFNSLFLYILLKSRSQGSSVGIATSYGLDDPDSGVWFLVGAGNFSLLYRVQTGSEAQPASYPIGTGGKTAVAWSWPLTSF